MIDDRTLRTAGGRKGETRSIIVSLLSVILCALCVWFPVTAFADETPAKLYGKPYIGEMKTHKTVYEDTLINLARQNNLGFVEMRAANPQVDPWLPGEDKELVIPAMHLFPDAPREGIVINLPEMRLFAFFDDGREPVTHPLGVGRVGLSTPMGTTEVVRKRIGPTWRPTARMREEDPSLPEQIPPGSDNPLGTHALYLGWPQYAIHGTNRPYGIGRRVSSGCIRLYPENIVTFFDKIEVGTPVRVVDQPVKAAWIDGALYIEAHPSLTQADYVEQHGGIPPYEMTRKDMGLIIKTAGDAYDSLDWQKIRAVIRERKGYPVAVAKRTPEARTEKESETESGRKS